MSLHAAYIGIILIWSTTPLAIKWSGDDAGFLFGVTSRMLIGTFVCILIMLFMKQRLQWHSRAVYTYLAASIAVYGSMMSIYWGTQFISSGMLSVLFGLTPLLTGVLSAALLKEKAITPSKIFGILLGIAGLFAVFQDDIILGDRAMQGIMAILFATLLHSLSTVLVKRIDCQLPGIVINTGSLSIASILFIITWIISGSTLPEVIPVRSGLAILYLGILGNVVGFTLYYYALKHMDANKIGMIPLITPVMALMLGNIFNGETISTGLILGAALIMSGLVVHQWGPLIRNRLKTQDSNVI